MYKLSRKCIIAIDGGSGVGKTTVSKNLSKKLGIIYIDTGAMYRATGLYFLNNNIEINDENIKKHISNIDVDLKINEEGENLVFLNGENVTDKIRTEKVSMAASDVSKNSIVRKMLVEKQRALAGKESVVIEGRDTTTVIFPNADIKLFFVSNLDVRSSRRYNDLRLKDSSVKLERVKEDIKKRDMQDSTRDDSPLTKTDDSILIDTSNSTVEQTTNRILDILKERIGLI